MASAVGKFKITCTARDCKFVGQIYDQKSKAQRLAQQHGGWPGHTTEVVEIKPLSNKVRVGDRIKLKEGRAAVIERDAKRAGWDIDRNAIRVVTRIDKFGPGRAERLFFDGPPFAYLASDAEIAWNSDEERRAGLGIKSA